jgi:hypothetical protein
MAGEPIRTQASTSIAGAARSAIALSAPAPAQRFPLRDVIESVLAQWRRGPEIMVG